jgi:sugar-specific transcriptional regulator TrmB
MAQRDRDKAKRPGARQAESAAGLADAVQRLEARAKTLERERDGLKTELEAARERIRTLEEARAEVVNRIDWVIDSLQNVVDRSE